MIIVEINETHSFRVPVVSCASQTDTDIHPARKLPESAARVAARADPDLQVKSDKCFISISEIHVNIVDNKRGVFTAISDASP